MTPTILWERKGDFILWRYLDEGRLVFLDYTQHRAVQFFDVTAFNVVTAMSDPVIEYTDLSVSMIDTRPCADNGRVYQMRSADGHARICARRISVLDACPDPLDDDTIRDGPWVEIDAPPIVSSPAVVVPPLANASLSDTPALWHGAGTFRVWRFYASHGLLILREPVSAASLLFSFVGTMYVNTTLTNPKIHYATEVIRHLFVDPRHLTNKVYRIQADEGVFAVSATYIARSQTDPDMFTKSQFLKQPWEFVDQPYGSSTPVYLG